FRRKIDIVLPFQFRTIKAHAHAIRIGRDCERFACETLNRYIVKSGRIASGYEAQNRIALCWAYPIVRRGPRGNTCSRGRWPRSRAPRDNICISQSAPFTSAALRTQICRESADDYRHTHPATE